jgi:aspartyl-tRNA(Asn)/glutamyl-tRNA(Gln) amidotransferase subunit B
MAKERLAEVLEQYEAVIGLEIHTELTACATKMFCGCPVEFGGEPNTRTCPVCLGLPGSLPVPNDKAIEYTVLAGLATDCDIALWSQFHRKNYFYPDMPKDYQISQYDLPFCSDGRIAVDIEGPGAAQRAHLDGTKAIDGPDSGAATSPAGYSTPIGITRIHLEEDTGKMVHLGGTEGRIGGATESLVDFNRAGTPLMELVTEPDIRTPEEARTFAQKLRLIFLTLGISDCSMEEGSMRVDANVSIRARVGVGDEPLEFGTKAEIKNMNSFKALHDGLAYEIVRQADVIAQGGEVEQETRHWDAGARRTSTLRTKEYASDYRYFPEPDLLPFSFTEEWIGSVAERLPELPDTRRARFIHTWGLPAHDATVLTGDLAMAAYFEAAVNAGTSRVPPVSAKAIANWQLGDLAAHLNAQGLAADQSSITPARLVGLVGLVEDGTISGKQAKEVFAAMVGSPGSAADIVERLDMKQVSDSGEIEAIVDRVIAANPQQVESYRAGKTGLMGFFVGQVMRETGGQANPKVVNEVLGRRLSA